MDERELQEIERRFAEATAGGDLPWALYTGGVGAEEDIRALIAEVRRLRSALTRAYGVAGYDGMKPIADYATGEVLYRPPEQPK
jgi:hypothetical protein